MARLSQYHGLDAIDFRLTDAISDPPGENNASYSEKLFRLPSTFSCYGPDANAPALSPLPATKAGAVAFGCFNNFAKITPEVITLWARLLRDLPDARLHLKSRGLDDPSVAQQVLTAFANAGVARERVTLNGEELSVAEHLNLYRNVDIALDPFPYNGTTTTCEALWMEYPLSHSRGRRTPHGSGRACSLTLNCVNGSRRRRRITWHWQ